MAATPGMFCEAMVTMNSGKAKLTAADQVNTGATKTGTVRPAGIGCAPKPWVSAV